MKTEAEMTNGDIKDAILELEGNHKRRQKIKDVIRDEIFAAGNNKQPEFSEFILIRKDDIKKIAKRIIKRTSIGPV